MRSTNRNFLIPNVFTVISRSTNSARPRFGSSHSAADHTGKFSGHVAGVGLRGDHDRKRYGTSFPGKAEPGRTAKKNNRRGGNGWASEGEFVRVARAAAAVARAYVESGGVGVGVGGGGERFAGGARKSLARRRPDRKRRAYAVSRAQAADHVGHARAG